MVEVEEKSSHGSELTRLGTVAFTFSRAPSFPSDTLILTNGRVKKFILQPGLFTRCSPWEWSPCALDTRRPCSALLELMRPALQRLLNRPSSIIVLETLLRPSSSPSSLPIVLRDNGTCPRCNRGDPHTKLRSILRQLHNRRNQTAKNSYPRPPSDAGSYARNAFAPRYQRRGIATSAALRTESKKLSYEELLLESDVGHEDNIGSRLVDLPEHREDFALWLQLLQFQQQNYQNSGILDIWRGMMIRCGDLELPVEGYLADEIWGIFARQGIEDKDFLQTLFRYAQRLWKEKGKRWPKLYSTIVGGILEERPRLAWHWHILLRDDHFQSPNDVRLLFPWKMSNPRADRTFKHIYNGVTSPKIYTDIIPRLCEENRFEEALRWHDVFLRKKDLPTLDQVMPLIQYLQRIGDTKRVDELTRTLTVAGVYLKSATMLQLGSDKVFTPQTMSVLFGQDHEHAPAAKSDEFCARLFATGSFGFGFVLIGLQVFGVKAVGPISVREIAIAAGTPEAIEDRFRQLKEANIDVGHSAFVRLVQKLARANDAVVLQDLLDSDQHPDVLEDWALQEKLLRKYHWRQDHRQVQKTMAVLTLDSDSEETVWNLRLRIALACRDRFDITKIIEGMMENRIVASHTSVAWMYWNILSWREKGERDSRRDPKFDSLGWLVSLWQAMLKSNIAEIRAYHWRDAIKRLGMAQRWDDLQALLLWLAAWYAPIEPETSHKSPVVPTQGRNLPVRVAPFDKRYEFKEMLHFGLQRAIVEWGFIHPYHPSLSPSIAATFPRPSSRGFFKFRSPNTFMPWTRGLVLLKALAPHGIPLDTTRIRNVCRKRLSYFFGTLHPQLITRPKHNWRVWARAQHRLRAQRTNQWSLQEFLTDAETVWPGLFTEFEVRGSKRDWKTALVNPKTSRFTRQKWRKRHARIIRERSGRSACK
jgi:hypothetical protein